MSLKLDLQTFRRVYYIIQSVSKKRDTFENVCQINNIHFCGIILVCMESLRIHLSHDMNKIKGKLRIGEQCSFKYEV